MMNAFFAEQVTLPGKPILNICRAPEAAVACLSDGGLIRFVSILRAGVHATNVCIKNSKSIACICSCGSKLAGIDSEGCIILWDASVAPIRVAISLPPSRSLPCIITPHPSGQAVSIGSENGDIVHYDLNLRPIWDASLTYPVERMEWASDGLVLALVFSGKKHISFYDVNGVFFHSLPITCLDAGNSAIVDIAWGLRGLAIVSRDGKGQILTSVLDGECSLVDCEVEIVTIEWCSNGECLALASTRSILLYSWTGDHLKTVSLIDVFAGTISVILWDEGTRRMFVAVDNVLCTVSIPRTVKKAFSGNASVIMSGPNEITIFPSACKISVPNLVDVRTSNEKIVLLIRTGDSYDIQVMTPAGDLVARRRVLESPYHSGFTFCGSVVAIANASIIQKWNIETNEISYIRIDDVNLEIPGLSSADSLHPVDDSIVDICYSPTAHLAVTRESGLIHILVGGKLEKSLALMARPERIFFNCDASLLAIIDMNNKLHTIERSTGANFLTTREECWDVTWALDDPSMLACLDKNKLYILRGPSGRPEEPLLLQGNILMGIKELEVFTLSQTLDTVETFPTKTIRDFTQVVKAAINLEDVYEYVLRSPHPRLWYLLAEHALSLEPIRLDFARRAQEYCACTEGTMAIDYISSIPDPVEQRMEVLFMLYRIPECEEYTCSHGREDLWLRLKKRMGDFESISKSPKWSTVASPHEIADAFFDAGEHERAIEWFHKTGRLSRNYMRSLLFTNQYSELVHVAHNFSPDAAILGDIARIVELYGLPREGADIYCRVGDFRKAFQVCAGWHRWDLIMELERTHGIRYADRDAAVLIKAGDLAQAVEVIRYGGDKNLLKPILQNISKSRKIG